MNLDRLKTLVGSRRSAAEDHVWLLREDPGYFNDTFKEWREHDRRTLEHECLHCWQFVAASMISGAFTYLLFWDRIYHLLDWMPSIEAQVRRANHKSMHLPRDEEYVWAVLSELVNAMIFFPISLLGAGLPPSPRMRHCYEWSTSVGKHKVTYDLTRDLWHSKPSRMSDSQRRVDILFHAIIQDKQRALHSLNHLVQEVQYMLDTDSKANQLVDSWVAGHFSDLALLSELKLCIEGLEPWSARWRAANLPESEPVQNCVDQVFGLDLKLRSAVSDICSDSEFLDDLLRKNCDYPAAKPRNEANVTKMRMAEERLDMFWFELEEGTKALTGLSIEGLPKKRLLEPREIRRTPEWIPPLIEQKMKPVLLEIDTNAQHFGIGSATPKDDSSRIKLKSKIKTRGTPVRPKHDKGTPTVENAEAMGPKSNPLQIKVPKRAFKVFSALLPQSSSANHQRVELAWDELLQAMNTIGLQPEKLYGSVWMFEPKPISDCKVEMKRIFSSTNRRRSDVGVRSLRIW